VQQGRTAAEVEAALVAEVDRLRDELVSDAEMTKVRKQVRAQIAYSGDSVTNQALMLGMWQLLDRYDRTETLLDEVNAVSAEEVRRVAQRYLTERNRTVGHFIPN
jgi:zinc protease